jgi:protein-S-isoprenylcysteine O-methyltransferase Ste14
VRLGGAVPHDPAGRQAAAIAWNLALFTGFAAHHSILARSGAKRWLTRWVAPSLERATYVWISSVLFYSVCFFWQPIGAPDLYRSSGAVLWIHRGVQALGVAVLAHASYLLDWLDLAGIRQAQGASAAPVLCVSGLYRWVRHPIYLGWALVVLGTDQMTAGRFMFAVVSLIYLVLAIPFEERSLTETFGGQYETYRQRVRWKVLPYIY